MRGDRKGHHFSSAGLAPDGQALSAVYPAIASRNLNPMPMPDTQFSNTDAAGPRGQPSQNQISKKLLQANRNVRLYGNINATSVPTPKSARSEEHTSELQ